MTKTLFLIDTSLRPIEMYLTQLIHASPESSPHKVVDVIWYTTSIGVETMNAIEGLKLSNAFTHITVLSDLFLSNTETKVSQREKEKSIKGFQLLRTSISKTIEIVIECIYSIDRLDIIHQYIEYIDELSNTLSDGHVPMKVVFKPNTELDGDKFHIKSPIYSPFITNLSNIYQIPPYYILTYIKILSCFHSLSKDIIWKTASVTSILQLSLETNLGNKANQNKIDIIKNIQQRLPELTLDIINSNLFVKADKTWKVTKFSKDYLNKDHSLESHKLMFMVYRVLYNYIVQEQLDEVAEGYLDSVEYSIKSETRLCLMIFDANLEKLLFRELYKLMLFDIKESILIEKFLRFLSLLNHIVDILKSLGYNKDIINSIINLTLYVKYRYMIYLKTVLPKDKIPTIDPEIHNIESNFKAVIESIEDRFNEDQIINYNNII